MTTHQDPDVLAACRARARRLLRQLRSDESADAVAAAERFRTLRSFAGVPAGDLEAVRARVQLKHALAIVAEEEGFASWAALTCARKHADGSDRSWYVRGMDVWLNRWFVRYDEARASLEEQGGYLLPYASHFFICPPDAIRLLGLDPDDPDWQRAGYDLARPADAEAFERLRARRKMPAA